MKKDIHPKLVPCKIYCEGEVVLETYSTKAEMTVDVWSGNHPFYTGSKKLLDIVNFKSFMPPLFWKSFSLSQI